MCNSLSGSFNAKFTVETPKKPGHWHWPLEVFNLCPHRSQTERLFPFHKLNPALLKISKHPLIHLSVEYESMGYVAIVKQVI